MDALLENLEDLKTQYKYHPEKHFCNNINQAWLKLDKYYQLTDESPAYLATMVLHPLLRWKTIEKDLWATKPEWVKEGKAKIKALWESEYKMMKIPEDNAVESTP